jgi:hypothetical protein
VSAVAPFGGKGSHYGAGNGAQERPAVACRRPSRNKCPRHHEDGDSDRSQGGEKLSKFGAEVKPAGSRRSPAPTRRRQPAG